MATTTISYAPGDGGFQTARATMDADAAEWAESMEAIRLRLLQDPAVIAAGGGQ